MTYPLKITNEDKALQKTTMEKIVGGLNTLDREDQLDPSEALRCENVILKRGRLYRDTGYINFADAIEGIPQTDYQFFKKAGTSELMLVTTASVYRYSTGANQWQFVKGTASTTLTAGAAGGATNLQVASSAGFVNGNRLGVTLDSGLQHRTTVSNIPDGTHITLAVGLPTAAANGNTVVRAVILTGSLDHHVVVDTIASHDWFVFTNGVNPPKRYDGTDCVDVPNLPSGGDTICRALRVYNKALFLLNTTEGGTVRPQRVRRSDIGDPENWTTGTAGFDDLLDSSDFIQAGETLGPYLLVYRERSIERGEFVGQGGVNYKFESMIQGEGVISTLGVVDLGDYHIFLGNANIYEYRAGFEIDPIGDKIWPTLYSTDSILNAEFRHRSFVLFVEETNEAWLFIPSTGSDTCDTLIRYNISEENFATRKFADKFVGYGFYIRLGGLEWGGWPSGSAGFWENQTWKWGSNALQANAPTTHLCNDQANGRVREYDYLAGDDAGVAVPFTFETKDFLLSDALIRLDTIEGFLRGANILVEYSKDQGVSWAVVGSVTNASNSKFLLGKQDVTQIIRFKFSGSDPQFMLTFFEFYWKMESAR